MITVVDLETTGLDPATDKVVEIATLNVVEVDGRWEIGVPWGSYVNPGRPIPPEASAIHHIVDDDVAFAPDLAAALSGLNAVGGDILAGHNCRFDRSFLPMFHEKKWIDTYRCAMHLWPDAPNFQNHTLRYWLKLPLPSGRAHDAATDVEVTAHILIRQLGERSVEDLLRLSTKRVALRKVGFGKHFGKPWSEVPIDYLVWANGQRDWDPDVEYTIKTELQRRAA